MLRRTLLLSALALPAAAQTGKSGPFRELKWEELVPRDWDPLKEFRDQGLGGPEGSGLSDSDPRAQEMLRRLREIWDAAPTVQAMNGQRVRLPGFVVPLDETPEGLSSFLLVPYFGACIHTPPPPANQIVHVITQKPAKVRTMEPVWVRGTLRTERNASAMGTSSYRLDAVAVEPYQEKAR
ncbi:MAG: DUF3299 domain-containing protein [Rubrivivax sp.]